MTPASNSDARKRKAEREAASVIEKVLEDHTYAIRALPASHCACGWAAPRVAGNDDALQDRHRREHLAPLLASVREAAKAEERERIAQAIEGHYSAWLAERPTSNGLVIPARSPAEIAHDAYGASVRIARGGAQ